jgi:hypothetical protein
MGKGTNKTGSKHSHFPFKKRCDHILCKKRAKYKIGDNYFCSKHSQ